MSWYKAIDGYRKVETRRGDTLQKIAARELGNAALWYDLATLNYLLPPYLTDDPAAATDRVLLTGSLIMVPAAAAPASGVSDPESVFGADIALPSGQLQVDESGDIAIVEGVPNLVQALTHRLATVPGDLLYHQDYGCRIHELIGAKGSPATNQLGAAFVVRALRADPRISNSSATATIAGDAVRVAAEAVTVDGKTVPVGLEV